jgi:hypothetical protein
MKGGTLLEGHGDLKAHDIANIGALASSPGPSWVRHFVCRLGGCGGRASLKDKYRLRGPSSGQIEQSISHGHDADGEPFGTRD